MSKLTAADILAIFQKVYPEKLPEDDLRFFDFGRAIETHLAGVPAPSEQTKVNEQPHKPEIRDPALGRKLCPDWYDQLPSTSKVAPVTKFNDPRVPIVYDTLADDDDWPPSGLPQEHLEGWISRRIVDRLFDVLPSLDVASPAAEVIAHPLFEDAVLACAT